MSGTARRTDASLPARRAEAKRRYEGGESAQRIALVMGVGKTTIRRWLQDEHVLMRSCARPAKYDRLPDRMCQACGHWLPPKPPSQDRTRRGEPRRFCTDLCAREWRGKRYTEACGKLLTVGQVAGLLGVTEHRVNDYRKNGLLRGVEVNVDGMLRTCYGYDAADVQRLLACRSRRKTGPASADGILEAAGELGAKLAAAYCNVSYPTLLAALHAGKVKATPHDVPRFPRPVYGFKECDLDAFKRAEAKRTDHWHKRSLDPEFIARISLAHGGDGVTAAARARARRADLGQRKSRGRPRRSDAQRWARMVDEVRKTEAYKAELLGEPAPSTWELYKLVALDDYDRHPEDWAYNPADCLDDKAAMRISQALKRLQKRTYEMVEPDH